MFSLNVLYVSVFITYTALVSKQAHSGMMIREWIIFYCTPCRDKDSRVLPGRFRRQWQKLYILLRTMQGYGLASIARKIQEAMAEIVYFIAYYAGIMTHGNCQEDSAGSNGRN